MPTVRYNNYLEINPAFESVVDINAAGNLSALQATATIIRQKGYGLVNNLETFKAWVGDVIDGNHLSKSGIFFIWDEFTEYVAHSDDHTVMQQISEFCKEKPLFMLYVVHRSQEMVDSMGKDRYQMITNRFHQVEFHVSPDAAFDLIAGSINTRNGMEETWKEDRKAVIKRIQPFLPDMSGLDDKISERAGTENIASIVGMAVALKKNCDDLIKNQAYLKELEEVFLVSIEKAGLRFVRNGGNYTLPGLLSLSFPGFSGEAILHRMDLMGICISTGSACDSVNTEISHVLKAIKLDDELARGTIRISLGKHNTINDVEAIANALVKITRKD